MIENHSPLKSVRNVLGTDLTVCGTDPVTGYSRDGFCRRLPGDRGNHVLCAVMTQEFLEYTASQGNDLSTPIPEFDFPGLKPGNQWCLCILRWLQALDAKCAPPVILEATHESALEWVDREVLEKYATQKP
ncbi:MAG: DUF2237 domain-containing protein [Verrucomicrobiota bacterium]